MKQAPDESNALSPAFPAEAGAVLLWDYGDTVLIRQGGPSASACLVRGTKAKPALATRQRLQHEFGLRERLRRSWAAVPVYLDSTAERPLIKSTDPGGTLLQHEVAAPWETGRFLRGAIAIAQAVRRSHEAGLIHNDLHPANVLVDVVGGRAWLCGFANARVLGQQSPASHPDELATAALTHAAPENIGRVSGDVDARSDLYSLGIVLYQMLSGRLPFVSSDARELMHAHMAKPPLAPSGHNPQVPAVLDQMVLKLMAKSPEDRYQSAAGIEADLRLCLGTWQTGQALEAFPLGSGETVDRLHVQGRLYGRDRDVQSLHDAFAQVESPGVQKLVLVSGLSGSGKSSIVAEFERSLPHGGAFFAAGKADQYQSGAPYAVLAQALQSLLRPLLQLPPSEQGPWRKKLQDAVLKDGQVIASMAPELEEFLGCRFPVAQLSPRDHQLQFETTLARFLRVFATAQMPLVLFLDDLQWVDLATLDCLLQLLASEQPMKMLLVGAFRSNEVGVAHPLSQWLVNLEQCGIGARQIALAPLEQGEVAQLLGNALACTPEAARDIAQLVHRTTAGNPYFVTQFINEVAEEGVFTRHPETRQWAWDMDRLRAHAHRSDVVELTLKRISKLPGPTIAILQRLSCLGSGSAVNTLAHVCRLPGDELHIRLWPAVLAGFCLRLPEGYRFLHDRVQEAAYALVPQGQRASLHLEVAHRLMEGAGSDAQLARDLGGFDLISQFNLGAAALKSREARRSVAVLNLEAAQRALRSAAHAAAREFAVAGLALLGHDGQQGEDSLGFDLELVCAESDLLAGGLESAERNLRGLMQRAKTPLATAAICRPMVELYVVGSRYSEAVESALSCLQLFGIQIEAHPTRQQVEDSFAEVMAQLGRRTIESLVDLELASDPSTSAAMNILGGIFSAAYFTDASLVIVHLCKMVRLTLIEGLTPASANGFAWFGVLIGQHFGRYSDGYKFADLARQLVDRHNFAASKAKTLFALEIASVWTQPLASAVQMSRAAFASGVERGDIAVACFACHHTVNNMLMRGDHLDEVAREINIALAFVRRARYRDVIDELVTQEQFVAALRAGGLLGASFKADGFDESAFEAEFTAARMPTMIFWYWVIKAQLHFLAGAIGEARADLLLARPWIQSAVHIQLANYHLFAALAAASADLLPGDSVGARRDEILGHLDQLRQWRLASPGTFADKAELAEAELARHEGRFLDAEIHFEEAIRLAGSAGCTWSEALANERAAQYYAGRDLTSIARAYLQQARYAYLRWGARAKVSALEHAHPWLAEESSANVAPTSRPLADVVDSDTVIRVSQAIASEIDTDALIKTLLKVALEHAGAQRALLFLPSEHGMRLEAQAIVDGEGIEVRSRQAMPEEVAVPTSVLDLVQATGQHVLIDDASRSAEHGGEAYFVRRRSRSVLCLALQKQGRLAGILYLENDLIAGAFTAKRIAILRLIAAQAAIALENARLYLEITRENRERRMVEEEMQRASTALRESESRFRSMADATPDVIWITCINPDRVLYVSPSFERIWGLGVEALYKDVRLWVRGMHPEDQHYALAKFRKWLKSDGLTRWEVEYRVLQPSGEIRWIHERGAFMRDDDSGRRRISGISTDVTEQRAAVLALQQSEERFALATVGSNDGIWDWDLTTDQMFMSHRAQQLYGLEIGATLRPRPQWVAMVKLHPEDAPGQRQMIAGYLKGEVAAYDGEWRVVQSDGVSRWIHIRGVCVRDSEGRPTRMAGSVSDVDSRRRAEAAMMQMQRLEAVGTLAGGVAHDFNNILAAILGFGEAALGRTRSGSRMRRDLEYILTAGERGRALVERILAFSRSSVGERVSIDVKAVIEESMTVIEALCPPLVKINTELGDGHFATMGDPTQVHQLVMNLATNAMHAMANGGTLQIALENVTLDADRVTTTGAIAPGEYIVVSVRDTGSGIAPDIQPRIFDPFFTTKDVGTGTGLGLSLVHGIVTELGGAIDVTTQLQVGSCFTVYLPRTSERLKVRPPAQEGASALTRGSNERILVVEDEEPLARLTCRMLNGLGYQPVMFTSAQDALEAFRNQADLFDAVVTDARMPRMTGFVLIRALREIRPDVPILLVSGFLKGKAALQMREAGADAALIKPFSRSDLARELASLLDR